MDDEEGSKMFPDQEEVLFNGKPPAVNEDLKHRHCCGFLQINVTYLPLKLLYLCLMAGQASCLIYQNIFMRHLGLSTSQVGLISATQRIFGIFTPPICGAISDKTRRPKSVLVSILLSSAVLVFSMVFVPIEEDAVKGYHNQSSLCKIVAIGDEQECNQTQFNETFIKIVVTTELLEPSLSSPHLRNTNTTNEVALNNSLISTSTKMPMWLNCIKVESTNRQWLSEFLCDKQQTENSQVDRYGVTFWLMMVLSILTAVTFNGSLPVVEATTFAILGTKNKHRYGRERLWASVGFGSASLIIGLLKGELDKIESADSNISYAPIFTSALIFLALSALLSYLLPITRASSEPVSLKNIKNVMRNSKMIFYLLLMVFPFGVGHAVLMSYAFWLAEEKLHTSSTILGISSMCGSIIDIPFFLASGWLIIKFGHNLLLIISVSVLVLRLYLMAVITEAWQIIPIEALRGVTWGLVWPVMCSFASSLSPPGLRATTVGIVYATSHGIGYAFGALVGGHIYQTVGNEDLFIISAWFIAVSILLYSAIACTRHVFSQRKKRREPAKAELQVEQNRDTNDNDTMC